MKIVRIKAFGTLTFGKDGGCHMDHWDVVTDADDDRYVGADELALMLFEFLAEQTRESILARTAQGLSTVMN